jgi:hypothetical protein
MEHDLDNASHPTHQLLDHVGIGITVALVPMTLHSFLCAYHLGHDQYSSLKTEMN